MKSADKNSRLLLWVLLSGVAVRSFLFVWGFYDTFSSSYELVTPLNSYARSSVLNRLLFFEIFLLDLDSCLVELHIVCCAVYFFLCICICM
jgi:hypothetical protein